MNFYKTLQTKWLVILAVLAGAMGAPVVAAEITLQWAPSPDVAVVGYRLYAKQLPSGTVSSLDVTNSTSVTLNNLLEGASYSVYLTAYNTDRVESDPSNQITYTVPTDPNSNPSTPGYSLQFSGFAHGTASYTPHGTMGPSGEIFAPGTQVTLTATAARGYNCTGWTINSVVYPGNPAVVTMNQNTTAKPVIKRLNGSQAGEQPPTQISLTIQAVSGQPTIFVGGELGAWTLESTTNFGTWTEVATGLTSEQLTMRTGSPHVFYRVRSSQLAPLQ